MSLLANGTLRRGVSVTTDINNTEKRLVPEEDGSFAPEPMSLVPMRTSQNHKIPPNLPV